MVIPYMPMLVPPVNWTGYTISAFNSSSIIIFSNFILPINLIELCNYQEIEILVLHFCVNRMLSKVIFFCPFLFPLLLSFSFS